MDRVNYDQRRLYGLNVRKYNREVCFCHQEQIPRKGALSAGTVAREPHGAHFHLAFGFLAGNIQHKVLFGQFHRQLQGERGLADARVAANQDDRTGHNAPAQHPGKFLHAHRHAFFALAFDIRQAARLGGRIQPAHRAG